MLNYRENAGAALKRANLVLERAIDSELHYAILDLRMALESLVYERALNYKNELSPKKLSTWQPKKLLDLLLQIDPFADQSCSVSFAVEDEASPTDSTYKTLGNQRLLSLKEIKKYYDKTGSYLHTKTIEQSNRPSASPSKIRSLCIELVALIDEVLSSSIINFDFRSTASTTCQECKNKIIRRLTPDISELIANCINCSASYRVTISKKEQVCWEPLQKEINCQSKDCDGSHVIWVNELKLGARWKCIKCEGVHEITPGIAFTPKRSL